MPSRKGSQSLLERVAAHHAHRNVLGRRNPTLGLFRTHAFAVGQGNIPTGTVFPDRMREITVSVVLRVTGSARGIIFELGSATTGLVLWARMADRVLLAAAGDAVSADGVTLTGPQLQTGQRLQLTFAAQPVTGKARLWVDGSLVAAGQATGGSFPNGWADTGEGAVGKVQGTVSTRVDQFSRIALANAAVVSRVSAAVGQIPRQFLEVQ